jgi:hypothetical protein
MRNSVCKYRRNSGEFRGIPGIFTAKNTAEFCRILRNSVCFSKNSVFRRKSKTHFRGHPTPDPGLHRRRCKVGAGFESEGGHLVLLVADVQREVMQGAANDGVGAIVQRLERQYVVVPPHEHRRCAGEVIGQLRRQMAGSCSDVSSGSMFGSTQCLRKLLKKKF